ncbi:hypothetical protein CC78DRAFT_529546 [Lojkania enalia]|uniref:Uncharacterized protein n=1 Tax=Lojkania enalia TaxID=147567 RepID=A0A9P4KHS7_9PLEO|nr:hypothetical protein CC78DRAFT_529546 [Didymosphaeria enalia]
MASCLDHQDVLRGLWTEHATDSAFITVEESSASMIVIIVAIALALALPRLSILIKLGSNAIIKKLASHTQGYGKLEIDDERNAEFQLAPEGGGEGFELQPLQPAHHRHTNWDDETDLIAGAVEINNIILEGTSVENMAARFAKEAKDLLFVERIQLSATKLDTLETISQKLTGILANIKEHPLMITLLSTLSFLFFALFIGYQAIAVCAAQIIGPTLARSASPHTGAWFPEILDNVHMSNISMLSSVNDFHTDMMFKAVAYADTCYKSNARSSECGLFYLPQLPYKETHNATCPFQDGMCLLGLNSAYELDTGFSDARLLGINYKDIVQFRIHKTCSPLVADEPFVKSIKTNHKGSRYVEYHYGDGFGCVGDGNKTFAEEVKPDQSDPYYVIREIRSDTLQLPASKSPRQWRPELQVPNSRVSLTFIRPINILYTKASSDPIFPATLELSNSEHGSMMQHGDRLYSTPHKRSTVLACADSIEIRNPLNNEIWHLRYQNLTQLKSPAWQKVLPSLRMINTSYLAPDYFVTRYTLASAHFNAPRRIRQFYSSPLDPEQWKLEVRRAFHTKLALTQFHVWGIAQGLGYELPRAHDLLADSLFGENGVDARGRIVFPAHGYRNIKVAELMVFLGVSFTAWLVTVGVEDTVLLVWVIRRVVVVWKGPVSSQLTRIWQRI